MLYHVSDQDGVKKMLSPHKAARAWLATESNEDEEQG